MRPTVTGGRVLLIALTGYASAADRKRAREAGFDLHMPKPVDPGELSRVLGGAGAEPVGEALR